MELLAPAGSPEALTAAVQAGADAVYLGFGPLNARRNAKNFTREELEAGVAYCHLRGVKVYLTLNTLLTNRELPLAAETGAWASDLGIDAVLVQDLGVARLLRRTCPDLPLHASTQMTVHSLDGVRACADLGMTRVVLSRELSADAIADLCARSPVELEVFGHGALCMCYSGQCFLSAVLGGRSGNRGLCAQPCRLAFRWPGEKTPSHPLSLKDLSLAGALGQLEEMGVACLKIEGRMKRPEYVAVVTGIYAAALRQGRSRRRRSWSSSGPPSPARALPRGISGTRRVRPCSAPVPRGPGTRRTSLTRPGGSTPGESTGRFPCLSPPRSRGRCPWFSPPGTRRAIPLSSRAPVPRPPAPARPRQTRWPAS